MKRVLRLGLLGTVVLMALLLLSVKRQMASEGYDTWEAVRNYLWRDGQVAVELRPNASVVDVSCSESTAVSWAKHRAVVRLGYAGDIRIVVRYRDQADRLERVTIETDKLNSWHRVRFLQEQGGGLQRIVNGVPLTGGFQIQEASQRESSRQRSH